MGNRRYAGCTHAAGDRCFCCSADKRSQTSPARTGGVVAHGHIHAGVRIAVKALDSSQPLTHHAPEGTYIWDRMPPACMPSSARPRASHHA